MTFPQGKPQLETDGGCPLGQAAGLFPAWPLRTFIWVTFEYIHNKNSQNGLAVPRGVTHRAPYDSAIPLLGTRRGTGNRYLHTHVHSGIGHESQTVAMTLVSISGRTDEQNVVHPHNGTSRSHEKERSPAAH